jgi:hypothetical protein
VRGENTPRLLDVKALAGVLRRNYDYDRFWVVFPLTQADGAPVVAKGGYGGGARGPHQRARGPGALARARGDSPLRRTIGSMSGLPTSTEGTLWPWLRLDVDLHRRRH